MPKILRAHRGTRSISKKNCRTEQDPELAAHYEILVRGHLDARWSAWFDGMTITTNDGETVIADDNIDQPRLRGVLNKIWDLNLTLISVRRLTAKKRGGK